MANNQTQPLLRKHNQLKVYQRSFTLAMEIFAITKKFPSDEQYSLTNQIRRSSRSVCANVAEAWRNRRYPAAFKSKLATSEAEAAETQTWLQFALACRYIEQNTFDELSNNYNEVIGMLVNMIRYSEKWKL